MNKGVALGVIVIVILAVVGVYALYTGVGGQSAQYSTVPATTAQAAPYSSSQPTIYITYNSMVGNYLADGAGYTLYIYARDTPYSNSSQCTGACSSLWPPFYANGIILSQSASQLNSSDFGTISRPDGLMQTTYLGHPLYTYSGDKSPGEVNGQGLLGVWFAATHPTLTTS